MTRTRSTPTAMVGCSEMHLRMLVAIEDRESRDLVWRILSRQGHSLVEAAGTAEAADALSQGRYAVVVMEPDLSDASDRKLLAKAKTACDGSLVALIEGGAEAATEALHAGAFDHLVKPLEEEGIVSAVLNRVIEKATLVRENQRLLHSLRRNVEEMGKLNATLRELAIRDGLTGLYNHRFFREALDKEVNRCRRHGRIFSLLMADFDSFKCYNDTNGHPAGDELLTTFADLIQAMTRSAAVFARYGGEEFVVLTPETGHAGALDYAERIRQIVEQHPFAGRKTQPGNRVTISIGVATFPEHGLESTEIIAYADRALYRAKENGRNTVC